MSWADQLELKLRETQAKLRASEAECERLTGRMVELESHDAAVAKSMAFTREENAQLRREVEDVRKLDASGHGWHMRDSSPGCEEVCYVPAVRSEGWYAPPGQHAAARRAAVEYLEKERRLPPQPQPSERVDDAGEGET